MKLLTLIVIIALGSYAAALAAEKTKANIEQSMNARSAALSQSLSQLE